MREQKIVYYSDELKDDFANNNIDTKPVEKGFKFLRKSFIWKVFVLILYRMIATPIALFVCYIIHSAKIHNKKVFKKVKKTGVFLYGNHTQEAFDAFIPSLISFPKRNHIIAGPDAFSIKGIKTIVQIMGGIPIPGVISNVEPFTEAIEYYTNVNQCITTFPEAHIWPYYIGIRPYGCESFYLPAKLNKPVIAYTVTYKKRKILKNLPPRIDVYISDVLYPKADKNARESAKELRDKCYNFMLETSKKENECEYIKYIKKDTN